MAWMCMNAFALRRKFAINLLQGNACLTCTRRGILDKQELLITGPYRLDLFV